MRFIKQVVHEENVVRDYGEMEVAPADPKATENGDTVATPSLRSKTER
jgi:hypothetical protein